MSPANKPDTEARVKALYYIMQSAENKLGGGEGIEGLYGSLTRTGMAKVLHSLSKSCGLDQTSRLVDVGAGLGRPLLHALISPGIASGFGIEIDQIKCSKAHAFLRQSAAALLSRGLAGKALAVPEVQCSAIEKVSSLDPATHAYSFWEGVPIDAKCAFGCLFAASKTLKAVARVQSAVREAGPAEIVRDLEQAMCRLLCLASMQTSHVVAACRLLAVAVVQRAMRQADPAEVMEELGFGQVYLVASFPVSMSGSGRSFTAYVFSKADQAQRAQHALLAEASAAQLTSPRQLIQQIIAESPSPIATPDVAAASRFPFVLDSTVKVSVGSKGVEAADERLDGRAVDHSFDKENAAESRIAERDMAACDVTELKANSHYTTVEDSEHRDASTAQHVEGNACKEVEHRGSDQRQNRHVSKASSLESRHPHAQGMRRSQRQQQQRQLKDKQLQAERQHMARISARVSTTVTVTTPSSIHSSSKTVASTVVSSNRSIVRDSGRQASFPNEIAQRKGGQREVSKGNAAKAAVGSALVSRKVKGSPTAGVKKQTSPVGKGSLALGARFPLRVRKIAEQAHVKGDLNGKFAQAGQNRGLGDLTAHMAASHAVV